MPSLCVSDSVRVFSVALGLSLLLVVATPAPGFTQTRDDAPLLVVGDGKLLSANDAASATPEPASAPAPALADPDAMARQLPAGAITQATPPTAPAAPAAQSAPAAPTPAAAKAPASPAAWPRDTVPIFLRACAGFHTELAAPCRCIITRLMEEMGHDEFLSRSQRGLIEQDPRYDRIRHECVAQYRTR